ncbi:hypothetical protein [Arcticibacter sp. MXS-1]|uniref:hypothetical protein n=1 Tax=Arcticibacter sp. MXS-1 TaxID=3341726 RepID=UPI0035A8B684
MKTSTNSISPFLILLVPVLLAVMLTISNSDREAKSEQYETASFFRMPSWSGVVQSLF